jgi:ferric-dicitrate binding protein FerR (iron transport regulator)
MYDMYICVYIDILCTVQLQGGKAKKEREREGKREKEREAERKREKERIKTSWEKTKANDTQEKEERDKEKEKEKEKKCRRSDSRVLDTDKLTIFSKGTAATTYATFSGSNNLAIPRVVMRAQSIAAATTA